MRWMPDAPAEEPGGYHSVDDVIAAIRELATAPLPAIDPPEDDAEFYGIRLVKALELAYKRGYPELYLAARQWERAENLATREAGRPTTFRILHARAYLPVTAARRYQATPAPF